MVINMNKKEFIRELVKKTNYDEEKCVIISDTLENNFMIGKKNKEKTLSSLIEKLNIDEEEANNIYDISSSIVMNAIKDKIKHPFRSKD